MSNIAINSIVSRQIPEFVREDYPTFVAFVEAYYSFLAQQQINLSDAKDLDKTLDSFIQYFKKEIGYNLPNTTNDRFILEHIRDLYLAKGSEDSYKLLFRILFGKEVEISYPGKQMLIPSDGVWNQEKSIFAKLVYGNADDIIGKVVTIEEGNKLIRVQVNKKQELTSEFDRVVNVGDGIYEFFLDRKLYGSVKPGNVIKYGLDFKAIILPTTSSLSIYDAGAGFRVGQVFEVRSSTGTGTLIKVTEVNSTGGIVHAQIIKFGVGYIADFTASIVPSDALTANFALVEENTNSPIYVDNGTVNLLVGLEPQVNLSEIGFINNVDYVDIGYMDGAYAGTVIKEFFFETKPTIQGNVLPAIIEIKLSAVADYPGYFSTNNGFLSDSIYIQDSKFYQNFSYVLKIDERLQTYKTAVKTMIHPAGMALFGDFEISNNIDLHQTLDSIVKSLGIGIKDTPLVILDEKAWTLFRDVSSPPVSIIEPTINNFIGGATSIIKNNISMHKEDTASASESISEIFTTLGKDDSVISTDNDFVVSAGLSYDDNVNIQETLTRDTDFIVSPDMEEMEETILYLEMNNTKYTVLPIQFIIEQEFGYVVKDPYEEGNYFQEIYVNNRDAIFSS